ncbi:integrase catalytic domain-containing protein [Trichonephila clavipes]|nr:integrase catalytic domain-containing protein [Trichonephila clavipes]
MKPPPNRVHFRPHSFPTLLEKVELRSRKCLYCNKGHELDACRSLSANEKREILRKKGCCYLCLSPGHRAMECVKRESCPICNGSHHFSICFRNRHDDDLSPKRDTDNIVSAVIKTDSEDILTMSVIVNESKISKQLSEFWDLENLGIEAERSTITHHLKKYVDIFPDTLNHLNQSLYVDDFLCGNVSVQAALTTCIESKQILEDASMDLRKLRTNSSELNQRLKNLNFEVDEHKESLNTLIASKVLGVGWNEKSDTFYFDSSDLGTFLSKRINTKRYLLQAAGRLFDPAYGTVAYLRIELNDGNIISSFVASKGRVAPLKTLSIPRLELMGALLSASTKATHLEVVSDLTTEAFLSYLRRFITRRSKPSVIWSDNATNFKGARNILNEWNEIWKSNRIQLFSAEEGIEWNFIPPASPHFGGLWEANIKSMKRILLRVAKSAIMNFEELTTLMAQIEAVLNSRPLSPLSSDPNDLNPLTPGHFLTNCAISSFSEPYTDSDSLSYHSRWKLIQSLRDKFWNRWSTEYLTHLQTRAKWSVQNPNLMENQLVLLKDPNTKPLDWPMGRILEVFPGSDGFVRVVNVKTSTGILKRAITKVVPLPIPVDPASVEKNI